jgi:NNP family nitrate/nitrite transporter-like MFS transporter
MTGFFDKNCVGSANALAAGFGNAGGGVTYFIMPAIYYSLRSHGMSSHVAWRVDFIVPGVVIVFVAACLFFFCPDTPTGSWESRFDAVDTNLQKHGMVGIAQIQSNEGAVVDVPGRLSAEKEAGQFPSGNSSDGLSPEPHAQSTDKKDVLPPVNPTFGDHEAQMSPEDMYESAKVEVVRKPTMGEIVKVVFSLQTFVQGACYFCSFGAELSINSILGTWYGVNFKSQHMTPQVAGDWAGKLIIPLLYHFFLTLFLAMFGLLNIVFRPLGGFAADYAYRYSGSVWGKKILLHTYAVIAGAFLIAIGVLNPHNQHSKYSYESLHIFTTDTSPSNVRAYRRFRLLPRGWQRY